MAARPRSLTLKGREYLERNLRGNCASALRAANTVANKLGPLVKTSGRADIPLVRQYCDDFERKVSDVLSAHARYTDVFGGDLSILADFNDWFRPRFDDLKSLLIYTHDLLQTKDFVSSPVDGTSHVDSLISLDYNEVISPEDSVSQVRCRDGVSRRSVSSKTSRSASKHSSRSSQSRSSSSVKSARVRESLKKVSLQAEAHSLAKRQDLLRKEFEINLEKETLDLSTRLAIASAKEEILLDVHGNGSGVSLSKSHGDKFSVASVRSSDHELSVKSGSFTWLYDTGRLSLLAGDNVKPESCIGLPDTVCPPLSVDRGSKPKPFIRRSDRLTDIDCPSPSVDSSRFDTTVRPQKNETGLVSATRDFGEASNAKQSGAPRSVYFDESTPMTRRSGLVSSAIESQSPVGRTSKLQQQVMCSKPLVGGSFIRQNKSNGITTQMSSCFSDGASRTSRQSHIPDQVPSISAKPQNKKSQISHIAPDDIATPNTAITTQSLNPFSPVFIPRIPNTAVAEPLKSNGAGQHKFKDTYHAQKISEQNLHTGIAFQDHRGMRSNVPGVYTQMNGQTDVWSRVSDTVTQRDGEKDERSHAPGVDVDDEDQMYVKSQTSGVVRRRQSHFPGVVSADIHTPGAVDGGFHMQDTAHGVKDKLSRSGVVYGGPYDSGPVGCEPLASGASNGKTSVPLGAVGGDSRVQGSVDSGSQFEMVLGRLSEVLSDKHNRLPEVAVTKFGGDPLEYNSFVRCFESRIASRAQDDSERLYYLEQYTSGTPRELVRSCLHLPPELGYVEACRKLHERYGDPFLISQAYLRKLESWPVIRGDDPKYLDQFTTFLLGCLNAMVTYNSIKELDYPTSLRLVVSKLPSYLQERWARTADDILHGSRGSLTFGKLVSFLERENRIKLNPVFGKSSLGFSDSNKCVITPTKKKTSTVATVVKAGNAVAQDGCLFCSNKHSFKVCKKFSKILHKEKIAFLMKHKLCFNCFAADHMRSQCTQNVKCDVCGGGHCTPLHRSSQSQSQEGQSTPVSSSPDSTVNSVQVSESASNQVSESVSQSEVSVAVSDESVSDANIPGVSNAGIRGEKVGPGTMPIVPVRLKLAHNDIEVCTHAFLDSGSSDSFITEHLVQKLRVKGKRTMISLTTLNSDRLSTECYAISNLQVCGLDKNEYINLPVVYSQSSLPVTRDQIPSQKDIDCWPYLAQVEIPFLDADVGILIGNNVPRASEPWCVVNSEGNGPYAVQTLLGWVVNGPLRDVGLLEGETPDVSVHRIQLGSGLERQVQRFFELDFSERHVFSDDKALSVEDKQFIDMVQKRTSLVSGHYEVCLPLRDQSVSMPNNRSLAFQRLMGLKRRFRDDNFKKRYIDFIEDLFVKGHASRVPEEEVSRNDGLLWYLPHHGVIHPRKDKLRVVLDASASFAGTSLNDQLLSGPDLSSTLIGVLNRFRQERVGFMADIECMFYQVKVPLDQRDLLRFLWWSENDMEREVIECRMHAHIFGATSSPAVAKYALRRTALDHASEFSAAAVDTINRSFYVDDCLRSVPSVEEAISLASELQTLTKKGGFRLTQWISNNRELLNSIPNTERAKNVKEVDLNYDELPTQKALGVLWSVEEDSFGFHVNVPTKPATRRGVLSIVSSVYDPLGMVAPVVLSGKMIVQELCRRKMGWDDQIPDDLVGMWQEWLRSLPYLNHFSIPRCLRPIDFEHVVKAHLHHFADASEYGYGCVTFLRLEDHVGRIHCTFMFGKSRVAPLKQMTIPRMELAGAVLAVRVDRQLRNELEIPLGNSYFWSDSTSVLGYIKNERARFHIFVGNRVAVIHENSSPSQWKYVPSLLNPADDASRGLNGEAFVQSDRWKSGPDFLWSSEDEWPVQPSTYQVNDKDPEVRSVVCAVRQTTDCDIRQRIMTYFSEWYKLRRFVALLLRALKGMRHRATGKCAQVDPRKCSLSMKDLKAAELVIFRWSQEEFFPEEIEILQSGNRDFPKSNKLAPLNPFVENGVLRVGGRIKNAPISENAKHPVILHPRSPVAELLVRSIHESTGHSGREQVLSRLRQRVWILHANALTRRLLRSCVFCRRHYGSSMLQQMADLPSDRVRPEQPPFSDTGVDYFGPILVKRGRCQVKRYGALFTCLATRAVHIEMASSLDTDSFINALRRFIARRGQVQSIRSDNGSNFVGAEKELREAIHKWNEEQIETFLHQKDISWRFNAPGASHHGGVWERLIRSTRRILVGLAREQVLTDDGLATFFTEVEAILNGRPLTRTSSDPNDLSCLTPNHLLLLRDQQSLPPGIFSKDDNYVRRRWKQIQYLSDVFWKRWVQEYLVLLQRRQKWLSSKRNVQVDDVVLLVDQCAPRGSWLLGRVEETFPDRRGHVRNVKVKTKSSTLTRPISKLVLILECDE